MDDSHGNSPSLRDGNVSDIRLCIEKTLPRDPLDRSSGLSYAAFMKKFTWPRNTGVLRVAFMQDSPDNLKMGKHVSRGSQDPLQKKYDSMEKVDIKKAIREIVETRYNPLMTNLKFEFVDAKGNYFLPQDAEIRITFSPTGSFSMVGSQAAALPKSQETMNFAWFDVATVLHEFGHALGLIHEHQNGIDDSNTIKWNKPLLYSYTKDTQGWSKQKTNKQIVMKYDKNQLNGSLFDPKSIMLYFFPPKLTTDHKGTPQNLVLSPTDKKVIRDMYGDAASREPFAEPSSYDAHHLTYLIVSTGFLFALWNIYDINKNYDAYKQTMELTPGKALLMALVALAALGAPSAIAEVVPQSASCIVAKLAPPVGVASSAVLLIAFVVMGAKKNGKWRKGLVTAALVVFALAYVATGAFREKCLFPLKGRSKRLRDELDDIIKKRKPISVASKEAQCALTAMNYEAAARSLQAYLSLVGRKGQPNDEEKEEMQNLRKKRDSVCGGVLD